MNKILNHWLERKTFYTFVAYYGLIYTANAVYFPYIGLYYVDLGYSVDKIGIFSAIGPVVAILTQAIWGTVSDKARHRDSVVRVTILGSLAAALLIPLNSSFAYVFGIMVLYSIFNTAMFPLSDAITFQYLEKSRYRFAPIRLAGTLGFAVMVIFAHRLIGNRISNMFGAYGFIMGITFLFSFLLPKMEGGTRRQSGQSGQSVHIWEVFRNGELVFLLAYCFFTYAILGFYSSFVTVYMRELHVSNKHIDLIMSLSAFSEVPVLLLIDRAMKRFGSRNILLFGGLAIGLRMFLFAHASGVPMLAAAQLLQGLTFISIYYCSVMMVNERVPAELRSSGQAVLSLITAGFARIVGCIGGGYLSRYIGLRGSFLVLFWIATTGTLILIAYFIHQGRRKKQRSFFSSSV